MYSPFSGPKYTGFFHGPCYTLPPSQASSFPIILLTPKQTMKTRPPLGDDSGVDVEEKY